LSRGIEIDRAEKIIDIAIIVGVALASGAGIFFGPLDSREKKK